MTTGIEGEAEQNGQPGNTNLERENEILRLLLKSSKMLTSEVELEKLVQRITDVGTELTGAAFGAFFYNVESPSGDKYVLYTISGVPKEAFSKFPMPRNTRIFNPTFTGQGITRYDDVTKEPHYGKNAPYYGMPKGHLPVRSYLAAPVISTVTNEVIGGLFFGHPEAGVFKEESEILIEGIAAQAAVAMTNARLFEEKKATELNLRERSEQYKSIFESTFDAIVIFDLHGTVVATNRAAHGMFELNEGGAAPLSGDNLFADKQLFESVMELVRVGRTFSGQGLINTLRGRQLNVDISMSSFAYAGKPHMLGVFSTLPFDAEKALEGLRTFSDVMMNASPVGLWMTDTQGNTIYVNQTWVDWTGKPLENHLGKGWASFILAEDQQEALDHFHRAFSLRTVFETEFRVRRADGKTVWCMVNGNPHYSRDGMFQGYAGSIMDITDRKLIEQKLYSQNVLINTITNNTLQALFMLDDRQYCTYMNPAAEQMTGFKVHELREKPLHYYIHHTYPDGRHFPIDECPIDRALPQRVQTQGEDIFIHRDGHYYNISFIASPIIENGVPKGTVLEVKDITEQKRQVEERKMKEAADKELLEQKVKERTIELEKTNYELLQFTSVASHDLKEPLRKISVFSKMLSDKARAQLDPSSQRYLDHIIQSAGRMTNLIDDLLFFSRLSQDNPELTKVDLDLLLKDILSDLEIAIQDKKAQIRFSNLPTVNGIPMHLGQVFQNLIANSLKFSHPDRTPDICISCEHIDKNGTPYHWIKYTDNGIGFNNKHAGKIFDIFQRLHTKDKYEGTGVGLAIVKKIISLHEGEVRAHGVEDNGATFEILLPA